LANKIAAYSLQDIGFDTVDANLHLGFPEDCREYTVLPAILDDMQISKVQLLTNNPRKVTQLERLGINVVNTLPMAVAETTVHNYQYMATKVQRMQHANLASLLERQPLQSPAVKNGLMSPLSVNSDDNGIVVVRDDSTTQSKTNRPIIDGVQANDDGYCFGRQSVQDAIAAMGRGELIVVVDDLDRENEGDFIMAADLCTAADMGQIVKHSSGVVCVALEEDRLEALQLPAMVSHNEDPKGTAFTVTVDATTEHGITTGISAKDRATTMRLIADPSSKPTDFHRPGHVLPLRARPGGVLTRNGHTEAAVDLAKLAGRAPAGVLCELVSEDDPTEMMRLPEIRRFCQQKGYVLTSIADLQLYRRETGL
jgi:3,4-dihydroxy 2-butanone 4-phosphate synthase/GTP cyclohydrolase II